MTNAALEQAANHTAADQAAADQAAADHIVRGTAAQGMIRALAISATNTVQAAQDAHDATPATTAALGKLMMAAQVIGSLHKDSGETISLMIRCTGPLAGLTVTGSWDGTVKGYAGNPHAEAASISELIGQGDLTVVRNSPHIEPYVSQIALINGTISDDLTAYYIISEQIPTIVALDVLLDEAGHVAAAGGYFIQLMPGYEESLLAELETAVSSAAPLQQLLENDCSPAEVLETLLGSLDYKTYEQTPTAFRCDCGRERCERTLISLGATELQEMIDEGNPVTIVCDYCSTPYEFSVEDLRDLISSL